MARLNTKLLNRHHAILLLGMLLTLAACGGGGGADASTTTAGATDGTGPAPSGAGASFTVRDLVGTWDNGIYVLTIEEGTEYSVAAFEAPDVELMSGFVAAMGTTISFATGTTGECPAQTGNYKGLLEGDSLTLTLSTDPCEARAAGFVSSPFTRTG